MPLILMVWLKAIEDSFLTLIWSLYTMFIYKVQENNLGIIVCRVDTNENIEYRYFQGLLSYPIHDKLKLLKSYDQIQEYLKTLFE
jgi:hypothetical protein